MRNTLSKFYPNLTSQERFQLVLTSLSRGDIEDMKRLLGSCPLVSYSMRDASFTGIILASQRIVDKLTILWLEASRRLVLQELDSFVMQQAAVLKGIFEGFIRFCTTAQIEPKKLLAWSPYMIAEIEANKVLLEPELPVDEETATQVCNLFCDMWPEELSSRN